jgi:2-methylisocitrate lyase-like PEP mutase family enzyme
VANTARSLLDVGAVGCNIEDSIPENGRVRTVAQQVERLGAARATAAGAGVRLFINARTDVFFETPAEQHSRALIAAAIERAKAYAEAGADGLFVPGLTNPDLVRELCDGAPLPVNIMLDGSQASLGEWAATGIARLSYGPAPYLQAMQALGEVARKRFRAAASS